MDDLSRKVHDSIERLKAFCPPEGYYLAFSGGKDSMIDHIFGFDKGEKE